MVNNILANIRIDVNGKHWMYLEDYGYVPSIYGGAEGESEGEDKGGSGSGDDDNFKQVQEFIRGEVQAELENFKKTQPVKLDEPKSKEDGDQLRDVLSPYIEPGINAATLEARTAKDYASFYRGNPSVTAEQEAEVEKRFDALVKAGRATSRADIYDHMVGQEYKNDPAKFLEKQAERKKVDLEKASDASDFGVGALTRAKENALFENFADNSIEDMEKKLEGVTF